MSDPTLEGLIQRLNGLSEELARLTTEIAAYAGGVKMVDPQDVLTEEDFRKFAETTDTHPKTITRTWNLLSCQELDGRLDSTGPGLGFRCNSVSIHRPRLITAKDHLKAGVIGNYGKSHASLTRAWIEHLKKDSSGDTKLV